MIGITLLEILAFSFAIAVFLALILLAIGDRIKSKSVDEFITRILVQININPAWFVFIAILVSIALTFLGIRIFT